MEYFADKDDKVLHMVLRFSEIEETRKDIVSENNFLQIAAFKLPQGKTFRAHKHLWKDGPDDIIAQEAWICLLGSFKAIYYNEKGEYMDETCLYPGDISVTLFGGHNYLGVAEMSTIIEVKTGPYSGRVNDKVFIDE